MRTGDPEIIKTVNKKILLYTAKTIYAIKIMRTGDPEIIKTVNKKILLYTILRLFKTFLMHQN